MNELTFEWVEKADGDLEAARRMLSAGMKPLNDIACFHCQQMAEKYLKAFLWENHVDFPKTHNLLELQRLSLQIKSEFNDLTQDLELLDGFSVGVRYPGANATNDDAQAALVSAARVRVFIRAELNLD